MTNENVYNVTKNTLKWEETEKNWLKSVLRERNVMIEFEKKDGSMRKMFCTLSKNKIPVEKMPKGAGKAKNDDVLIVFDVENDGWRSFRWDYIKAIQFDLVGE